MLLKNLIKNISKDKAKIAISDQDLTDAVAVGLCEDIVVGEYNKLKTTVNYKKLLKVFPALRLQNAIDATNKEKSGEKGYS